jgi:hypothetical protein
VARAAYTDALREVRAGILSVDARRTGDEPRFSGVALHWLLGLLMLADGHEAEALAAFERECALEESRHLYARECAAHAWYAMGAVHLRRGEMKPAATAFQHALDRIALHPMAHLGLALADGRSLADLVLRAGRAAGRLSPTDRALAVAAFVEMQSLRGEPLPDGLTPDTAAAAVVDALASAEPGNAGWLLPVEPLVRSGLAPERWSAALARLRARAA